MDLNRWWNCRGVLGRHGGIVFKRGFPSTNFFAQARVVFAVARTRCNELFSPPGCLTLWNLPAEIEDRFEESWQDWLDKAEEWASFFQSLAQLSSSDLLAALSDLGLLTAGQRESVLKLRRSAEGRAVPLPGVVSDIDEVIPLLAAGFSRGETANPAVPYARWEA